VPHKKIIALRHAGTSLPYPIALSLSEYLRPLFATPGQALDSVDRG
jgi:hypothetical protein